MTDDEKKAIDRLKDAQHEQASSFDKAILSLSSGGLVLSLAVVKDLVNTATLHCIGLLITSWCGFGLSILAMVVSFRMSMYWIQKYLESDLSFKRYHRVTRWTNHISIITLATGVVALLLFATINISSRNTAMGNEHPQQQETEKKHVQEGYDILPPDKRPQPEPPPPPQKGPSDPPPSQQ